MCSKLNRDARIRQQGLKGFFYWWFESQYNLKRIYVDITIIFLILLSVIITVIEFFENNLTPSNNFFEIISIILTIIFVLEYLIRLYISTDFCYDIKKENGSLAIAFNNKLQWILKPSSIVDFISFLPMIRFIRVFRFLRIIKFVKLLRILRVFMLSKYLKDIYLISRSIKESTFTISILFVSVFIIISINSLLTYLFDHNEGSIRSFNYYLFHSLNLIKIGDEKPFSVMGKLISSITLIVNILFFSILISVISNNMKVMMDKIKHGKIGFRNMQGHIIVCGLSNSTKIMLEKLSITGGLINNHVVLITSLPNPEIKGVKYLEGDFTDIEILKGANVMQSKMCIVSAEMSPENNIKNVDMRTIITTFHIKNENPKIHVISEIINKDNARILKEKVKTNEIIMKENLDALIILNSIRTPDISEFLFELLNPSKTGFNKLQLSSLGINTELTYKDLKMVLIERTVSLLGIETKGKILLNPPNDFIIKKHDKIIYIES